MTDYSQKKTVVSIDFINDIVHQKGKLARKGYADFIQRNSTLDNVEKLFSIARSHSIPIIHIRVGFSGDYKECSKNSPLFSAAPNFGVLQLETWGTEFHSQASPRDYEIILNKHRVSAFYGTSLDLILRANGINELIMCGVATDLAVQSASSDAHDRDYITTVVSDCCAAASEEDHYQALRLIGKIASVKPLEEINI